MKYIGKKIVLGCLAGVLATAGLTGCSNKLDGSSVVVTINGEQVPLGVVSFLTRYQQAQTQAMYEMYFGGADADLWDQEMDEETGETYGESARNEVLEQVEVMYLLKEKAKDYDVELTEDEQNKITEAAEEFIKANSEETLTNLGVSQSDIEAALEIQTYETKMFDPMVADVDTKVSDEEAQQTSITYVQVDIESEDEEDTEEIEETEEEISDDEDEEETKDIDPKEKAQQILDEVLATADADMDAIAQDVDEELSAIETHFTTNPSEDEDEEDEEEDVFDTEVPQAVQEAVRDLADGEVASELIEDDDAYYVVRLEKVFDEEATEEEKESIVSERQQEAYDELIETWKDEADIQVDQKVLKTLKVTSNLKFTFKQEEEETEEETDESETLSIDEEDVADEEDATDESDAADEEDAVDESSVSDEDSADTQEDAQEDDGEQE